MQICKFNFHFHPTPKLNSFLYCSRRLDRYWLVSIGNNPYRLMLSGIAQYLPVLELRLWISFLRRAG